jgi:lysyl-tRNA synthetase class 2
MSTTATKLGTKVKESWGLGKIQIEIFEATVEEKLMQTAVNISGDTFK